jgi:hypothetical protein
MVSAVSAMVSAVIAKLACKCVSSAHASTAGHQAALAARARTTVQIWWLLRVSRTVGQEV